MIDNAAGTVKPASARQRCRKPGARWTPSEALCASLNDEIARNKALLTGRCAYCRMPLLRELGGFAHTVAHNVAPLPAGGIAGAADVRAQQPECASGEQAAQAWPLANCVGRPNSPASSARSAPTSWPWAGPGQPPGVIVELGYQWPEPGWSGSGGRAVPGRSRRVAQAAVQRVREQRTLCRGRGTRDHRAGLIRSWQWCEQPRDARRIARRSLWPPQRRSVHHE